MKILQDSDSCQGPEDVQTRSTDTRFNSQNYSLVAGDPYGSRNVQLESWLSRVPYSLVPNRMNGCYANSYKSLDLDLTASKFLARMMELQKRVYTNCPLKFKRQQRLVFGSNEIAKLLTLGKLKSLFAATNLEPHFVESNEYREIIRLVTLHKIPIIWCCTRNKLGDLFGKRVGIALIGTMFDDGVRELHDEIIRMSNRLKEEWTDDVLKMTFNPYSVNNETVLWIACYFGHIEVVQLTCRKYPAMLHIPDIQFGMLPIHVCACNGHFDCFSFLAELHPELLERWTADSKDCCYLATANGHYQIVKFILEKWNLKGPLHLFERIVEKYDSNASLVDLAIQQEHQQCFLLFATIVGQHEDNCNEVSRTCLHARIMEWMELATSSNNVPIWNMLFQLAKSFDVQLMARPNGVIAQCFQKQNLHIMRMILNFVKKRFSNNEAVHSLLYGIQVENRNMIDAACGTIFEADFRKFM